MKKWTLRLLALMILAALSLSACSQQPTQQETTTTLTQAATTATEPAEETTTPAQEETSTTQSTTAKPFAPDYSLYHQVLDGQYANGTNSDYNTYTLADTNEDGVLELVLMVGNDEYSVEIYTLTAQGVELLEKAAYPSAWLTNAAWVATIDDTNYERYIY